jgi:hypothetical protein
MGDDVVNVPARAQRFSSTEARVYAGIGSRTTPPEVLRAMEAAASQLARSGWTLRTGMSPGADQAFYLGAVAERGRVELYLPRPPFEPSARSRAEGSNVLVLGEPTEAAYALAARFHPCFRTLSLEARHLRARDVHEVLGRDLASPAALVVCWTPDGSVDGTGRLVGGTGQALRIARHRGIPVLNLARPDHARRLSGLLERR